MTYVCDCCALVIANGDDSGCRDYYGHDHPACDLPATAVIDSDSRDEPSRPWTCDGCGSAMLAYAGRWAVAA